MLPDFRHAVPAIVMAAGCAPFFSAETPESIKAGGACLLGVAMILVDLQSGKKLGYTDKIVGAMRKIPGLQEASEGEVLGFLTLGASVLLGGTTAAGMMQSGSAHPGWINLTYNAVAYPLGAAFGMSRTQRFLESRLGKELSFTYTDKDGAQRKTAPISTSRLLQQVAYLSGAAGVTSFGVALDHAGIEFTGLMFALSNGLSIAGLTGEPVKEVVAAKMGALQKALEKELDPDAGEQDLQAHWKRLREQWDEASRLHAQGEPVKTRDLQAILRRAGAVLAALVQHYWSPPEKTAGRDL